MACYKPLTAWYSKTINPTGKRSMVFSSQGAEDPGKPLELPCGQCVGCRLEKSRQWAMRCWHEASMYENNCFITLTFNEESMNKRTNPWSLDKREFQLFMKRLRKRFGAGIRFYSCGEYGDKGKRPHYHACLFNFDFDDKEMHSETFNGDKLYTSKALEELWPYGFCLIGDVTFESASYVARYIMKKVNGQKALEHYNTIDPDTGEILTSLSPEYTTMSRRPGIGATWLEQYEGDVYPKDFVTVRGKKMRPAKFYDKMYEAKRPYEFNELKEKRKKQMLKMHESEECGIRRLRVKEEVQKRKARKLVRNHDKGEVNVTDVQHVR